MLFFFQAEDGIRDLYVTGVQTCALPILSRKRRKPEPTTDPEGFPMATVTTPPRPRNLADARRRVRHPLERLRDRKSTRLNSSHVEISYAVFCLKKKIPQNILS